MRISFTISTQIKFSFRRLINIVPQNGMILLNGDDPNCVEVAHELSRAHGRDRLFGELRAADPRV